jgi:hypothetical protein
MWHFDVSPSLKELLAQRAPSRSQYARADETIKKFYPKLYKVLITSLSIRVREKTRHSLNIRNGMTAVGVASCQTFSFND